MNITLSVDPGVQSQVSLTTQSSDCEAAELCPSTYVTEWFKSN